MTDRILVTGATGKTGSALVRQLRDAGVGVRAGTRRPKVPGDIAFDWRDPATFDAALDGVTGIYLVAPTDTDQPLELMRPFLERVRSRRLVLLSASSLLLGGPMMGAVHEWLAHHATNFAVLRPTWFMQNITTQHLRGIVQDGAIYSATEDGRIPFIDTNDIAAVAASLLTSRAADQGSAPVLKGPQVLSYNDVARMLTEVCGRTVRHVRLSAAELAQRFESFGLPTSYAATLAALDREIVQGAEDRITNEVERWTGRKPNDLRTFLTTSREIFDA